jgi:hypothetical protein
MDQGLYVQESGNFFAALTNEDAYARWKDVGRQV